MRRLLIILTFILALAILVSTKPPEPELPEEPERTVLNVWGMSDLPEVFEPMIDAFEQRHPEIAVEYKLFADEQEYFEVLMNELDRKRGPDLLFFSNSRKEQVQDFLTPTSPERGQDFAAFTQAELSRDGLLYALPLWTESLMIFANLQHFPGEFPNTWDQLGQQSQGLSIGGIAMGKLDNLRAGWDILSAMLLQQDVDPSGQDSTGRQEAVDFYARFANPTDDYFNWSEGLNKDYQLDEIESFTRGKVASIAGYPDTLELIYQKIDQFDGIVPRSMSRSDLSFARLPQQNIERPRYLSSYMALGVSVYSEMPDEAWELLTELTSESGAQHYAQQTGKVPGRVLLSEPENTLKGVQQRQVEHSASYQLHPELATEIESALAE